MAKLIELEHTHFNFHYFARPNMSFPFRNFPLAFHCALNTLIPLLCMPSVAQIKKPLTVSSRNIKKNLSFSAAIVYK
jgi:hypothetical protein